MWKVFLIPTVDSQSTVEDLLSSSDKSDEEESSSEEDDDVYDKQEVKFIGNPCQFIRVRVVQHMNGYLFCSCGWSNRNKMPCRHIFRVVNKRHPDMYHVRWLSEFQYHHFRDEEYTKIFSEKLKEENGRRKFESVCVKGMELEDTWKGNSFPILGDNTTHEDVLYAKSIIDDLRNAYLNTIEHGRVSFTVDQPGEKEDTNSLESTPNKQLFLGEDSQILYSQHSTEKAKTYLYNSAESLNHSSCSINDDPSQGNLQYSNFFESFRTTYHKVEGDKELSEFYMKELNRLSLEVTRKIAEKTLKSNDDQNIKRTLVFDLTSTTKKTSNKRQKAYYEK
jgi:hypothetical protein